MTASCTQAPPTASPTPRLGMRQQVGSGLRTVRKVLLHEFNEAQTAEAKKRLALAGIHVVAFRSGADAVLIPDPTNDQQRAGAAQNGHRVLTLEEACADTSADTVVPVISSGDGCVTICGHTLAKTPESPLTPRAERFQHLLFDEGLVGIIHHLAQAVALSWPVLLEGATAAAKTTAVLWLARQLGRGVLRLNCSGHSDTAELIGRFLPSTDGGWHFHEGAVPTAMRSGTWLLLDEMNLAAAEVIERLNPVLEQPAGLHLAEHDGRIIGDDQHPVHPDFRCFATMNPSEYAGRSELSPAFRDRWTATLAVTSPGLTALQQLMRMLISGEQPVVLVPGIGLFQGPSGPPAYPALASLADDLEQLAVFHHHLNEAAASGRLASQQREQPVFTRRRLLATVHLCEQRRTNGQDPALALRQAIRLCYLNVLPPGPARDGVEQTLITQGLQ